MVALEFFLCELYVEFSYVNGPLAWSYLLSNSYEIGCTVAHDIALCLVLVESLEYVGKRNTVDFDGMADTLE
jgi:hypothetical protein